MIEADFAEVFASMNMTIARLANHGKILDRVGTLAQEQVKERIKNSKQDPDGGAWAPRKNDQPHPLLFKSGGLYAAINKTSGPSDVVISPDVDYAKFLQLGTKNMPARAFMGFGHADQDAVMAEFAFWINEALQ